MALTEQTRLYEVLARVERGPTGDRIVGMHLQTITEILRDKEVISATENPPVPATFRELIENMHPEDLESLKKAISTLGA